MSNKNVLLMLHDGLSRETNQTLYPADLACLLGYGATQIKQYFKWATEGEIKSPNDRLERAATFAYRIGELEGFSSLFPLIPKLSGNLDNDEWMRRTSMRMNKMMADDSSTAGQLDLIDNQEAESDHQIKQYFGFVSPLGLGMIKHDTESGHITESYEALITKLNDMFGEKVHYDFEQVKAALVAIECPEMVSPVESGFLPDAQIRADLEKPATLAMAKPSKDQLLVTVEDWCKNLLPESTDSPLLAEKIVTACEQLEIIDYSNLSNALHGFINDVSKQAKPIFCNIRIVRNALRDSQHIKEITKEAESAQQDNDILWPDFVDASTRKWLEGFDREQLDYALGHLPRELVVQRILAGYVKEQKQRALDLEMKQLAK